MGKALVIKADSVQGAQNFANESLDLVYIDAAHDYISVTKDLGAWWPKVKKGGILAGHDYEGKPDDGYWGPIEVKDAVDTWASHMGLVVNSIEPSCPSFWVVK